MKQIYLLFLLLPVFVFSQIPSYYSNIDFSETGDDLKSQLNVLITDTHTTMLEYSSNSSIDTWDVLLESDLNPTNSQDVLLVYGYNDIDGISKTDRTRDKDLACHTSGCIGLWNREHVFSKSLAEPSLDTDNPGSGTDTHNLRAADSQMNSSRSNRPYIDGEGDAGTRDNGTFYPGDEWRGDVARIIMYMYVRYPNQCEAISVGEGSTSYSNFGDMPNIFLEWNTEDPVSSYEINRNNTIASTQGNRNPFIDNPYLATIIWNGPDAEDTWNVLSIEGSVFNNKVVLYPTITSDYIYISNSTQEYDYSVYNILGQEVDNGITSEKIDLSGNRKGMYIINLISKTSQETYKVLVK